METIKVNTEGISNKIIFQCSDFHSSRVGQMLSEKYGVQVDEHHFDLIFTTAQDPFSADKLLPILHSHKYLLRYIHQFYPWEHTEQVEGYHEYVAQIVKPRVAPPKERSKELFNFGIEHFRFLGKNIDFSNKVVRCVVYPRDIKESFLSAMYDIGVKMDPKNYTHFLSIVFWNGTLYYGFYDAKYFFVKDNSLLNQPELISRALYKIREIVDRFDIPFQKDWKVIDCGAAPGGVSWYVAKFLVPDGIVAAIDPGELTVEKLPENIIYYKGKAENLVEEVREGGPYDVMIVDINSRPWMVMNIMKAMFPLMKPESYLLWTVKLPPMNGDLEPVQGYMERVTNEFLKDFPEFETPRVKWLLANKNERAFITMKKVKK